MSDAFNTAAPVPAFLAARGVAQVHMAPPAGAALGGAPVVNRLVFLFGEELHRRLRALQRAGELQAAAAPATPAAASAVPAAAHATAANDDLMRTPRP